MPTGIRRGVTHIHMPTVKMKTRGVGGKIGTRAADQHRIVRVHLIQRKRVGHRRRTI